MTRIIKWLWAVLLVAALAAPSAAWAGSIGFQAASAEDPMVNAFCTGSGAPDACCTGAGTGTCGPNINSICASNGVPQTCCTGAGTGNCNFSGNAASFIPANFSATAPRTLYQSNTQRAILAEFDAPIPTNSQCTAAGVPFSCCTGATTGTCNGCTAANTQNSCCTGNGTGTCAFERCVLFHFPMPPDYVAAANMGYVIGVLPKGNATCTAAGVPYPCCTGNTTGSCGVLDSAHPVCFHIDVGATANSGVYGFGGATFNYAAPTTQTCSTPSATTGVLLRFTPVSTILGMAGSHPRDAMTMRLCRDFATGGTAENTANMSLVDLTFTY